ncbi:MAG: RNA 2'-phosphotransferase [Pirellulaceae bacterium]|nr:RNA 2'-phosphotransferase [Pirellulaceae bacterium]
MDRERISASKFLSLVLRHQPETIGISLDDQGWVEIDEMRGSRRYVHLSPDVETARKVGQRRGQPVILVVESGRMWRDGHTFCQAENGVWLTEAVPTKYLRFDCPAAGCQSCVRRRNA